MKPGTNVKYTKEYTKWLAEHSDSMYQYPNGIRSLRIQVTHPSLNSIDQSTQEVLAEYFMDRYSYDRDLSIDGVIVGDNGLYGDDDFAYLVWAANDLGECLGYVGANDLEKL